LDIGVLRAILQKRGMLNGNEYESAIVSEIYKQLKCNGKIQGVIEEHFKST